MRWMLMIMRVLEQGLGELGHAVLVALILVAETDPGTEIETPKTVPCTTAPMHTSRVSIMGLVTSPLTSTIPALSSSSAPVL